MTRMTNARVAGWAFLAYFASGIPTMILMGRATRGEDVAARLATAAQHVSDLRLAAILVMVSGFCAIVLGVTLWAVTRDEDPDLAMLGLACRVCEGLLGLIAMQRAMALLWLATRTGEKAFDPAALDALGAYLLRAPGAGTGSILFAVGSACFSWLLLRGRMIPAGLAWLGVIASLAWIVGMPLQLVGVLPDALTYPMWGLMAAFEVPFLLWLIVKGVAPARGRALAGATT